VDRKTNSICEHDAARFIAVHFWVIHSITQRIFYRHTETSFSASTSILTERLVRDTLCKTQQLRARRVCSPEPDQTRLCHLIGMKVGEMSESRTITKHSNRRLYYPRRRGYLVLDDIYNWVVDGTEFNVIDNDGVDVTRSVLLQVIAAQEGRPNPPMSMGFLLQAIRSHARLAGGPGATFLEQSLKMFHNLHRARKTPANSALANGSRRAKSLAQANYKRWRSVQKQIYQTLANAASRESTLATLGRKSIVPLPVRRLDQRSRRSPRASGVTARR
jgi:polyhydroxyalkanoate synthesis repressor PhaR